MASPQIRFKEFDRDWSEIKISDHAETVTSGSRDWAQYYSDKGDKFIRMTNLVRNGIYLDLSDLRFVDLPKDSNEGKRTSLKFGDILISITAELGKLGWVNDGLGTAYINQHTALVRMNENVDSKFIAYTLSTEKYNNKLNNLNDSGAKAGLNLGTIRSFELTIPQKEEQTKIASFLSAVDEKISQLTQKHELLSQYKQGMMQKLFSQQIRFKADDGSEFGEWENLKFRDVITIKYGKDHKALKEGNIPVLGTGGIMRYVDSYLYDGESILIGRKGTIDKPQFISGKFWTVDTLFYTEIGERLIPKFAYQQLLLVNWLNLNEATGVPSLNTTSIGNIELKVPYLEEQTKIANFLSTIDQKIEVVTQQIEQAKQWKKGLLQQMFV